jgi:hypothetical protein
MRYLKVICSSGTLAHLEPLAEDSPSRPLIFQFWHDPSPPKYIQDLNKTWVEKCPEFEYQLYDDSTAANLIREKFGERYLKAYLVCRHAAARSDLFRLCALYLYSGVYVDADQSCVSPLYPLYQSCARGCLYFRMHVYLAMIVIPNNFMIVRRKRDPLLARMLETAVENIEKRLCNDIWTITGPGVATYLWRDGEVALFDGFNMVSEVHIRRFVRFHGDLAYKGQGLHWMNWQLRENIFNQVTGGSEPIVTPAAFGKSKLDDIPINLPAVARAAAVSRRAAARGLDSADIRDFQIAVAEELANLDPGVGHEALREKIGRLLYAATDLARRLDVEPENALRDFTAVFERRFRLAEKLADERGVGTDGAAWRDLMLEVGEE